MAVRTVKDVGVAQNDWGQLCGSASMIDDSTARSESRRHHIFTCLHPKVSPQELNPWLTPVLGVLNYSVVPSLPWFMKWRLCKASPSL